MPVRCGDHLRRLYGGVAMILLGFIKGRMIIRCFMEVCTAPRCL